MYDSNKDGQIDKDDLPNRTRKVFVPIIHTNGTWGHIGYHPKVALSPDEYAISEFVLPEDYVSLVAVNIVGYIPTSGGETITGQEFKVNYATDGEVYNTHTETSGTTSLVCAGDNKIDIKDTGLTLSSATTNDVIGIYYKNGDDYSTYHIIGFILEYTADM